MDSQLITRECIRNELERCQNLYDEFIMEFPGLPNGALIERNGRLNWFFREGKKQYMKRLKDEDTRLISGLKKRRYIKKGLAVLKRKITNCKKWLENDEIYDPLAMAEEFLPQYRDLSGLNIFLEGDINPKEWEKEQYEKGQMYGENLKHSVDSIATRSKSEAMIAAKLKEHNLLFRYESALLLNHHKVFPDFAILLRRRRRVIYWEHFGIMDDPEYAMRAMRKLAEYAKNGIHWGINLVVTFETKDDPLTMTKINETINEILKMDV